jgi:hypothetical protein
MSGSAPTNNSAVEFEEQQAAQAQQQEAARQARLTAGTNMINSIFDFSPATPASTSNYDWSTFQAPTSGDASTATGVPAGYTATYQNPTPGRYANPGVTTYATNGGDTGQRGGTYSPMASGVTTPGSGAYTPGTPGQWGLTDASGKFYAQGAPISITTPAKAEGGFGPDFYNNYKQKILDYYNPQEQKQFAETNRNLTYALDRSGNLNSSTAADQTGEVAYQDALAKASIVANANQQTGQLQTQILGNKQSLLNQLYATEDPTETANLAEASAKASQLVDPTLTPAASFFTPIVSGVASATQGLLYPGQQYVSPYTTPQGGTVAPANASSGKLQPGTFT